MEDEREVRTRVHGRRRCAEGASVQGRGETRACARAAAAAAAAAAVGAGRVRLRVVECGERQQLEEREGRR
jgi:hypothetical protein